MRGFVGLVLAGCVLVTAACGGSGGSSASDDEKPYVDAMAKSMVDDKDVQATQKEADCFAPRIVAAVGVAKLKAAKVSPREFAEAESLKDLGVTISRENEAEVGDAFGDCISAKTLEGLSGGDFKDLPPECTDTFSPKSLGPIVAIVFTRGEDAVGSDSLAQLITHDPACAEAALIKGVVDDGTLTKAQGECVKDKLDDGDAVAIMKAGLTDGDDWPTKNPDLASKFRDAMAACQ
jgi:hypothetical protein